MTFTTRIRLLAYNTPTTQKNYFRDTSFYLQDTWTLKRRLTLESRVALRPLHTPTIPSAERRHELRSLNSSRSTTPSRHPATWWIGTPFLRALAWLTIPPERVIPSCASATAGTTSCRARAWPKRQSTVWSLLSGTVHCRLDRDTNDDGIPQQSEWLPQCCSLRRCVWRLEYAH